MSDALPFPIVPVVLVVTWMAVGAAVGGARPGDSAAPHRASLLDPMPWPEEVAARRLLAEEAADLTTATAGDPRQ